MGKVSRVYPGPTNGLINWMEKNFHEIDGYVVTFKMKDGTTTTVYDAHNHIEAAGLADIGRNTIHQLVEDDEFVSKE
ncbi:MULTISPECIES: hypothetical protein [Bacillus subtilis group]|uniref:hypothetical protein n=1 Tax=Bacillus subtilis group TaxID=653685 RepID=UPI000BA63CC4|nr:MULTISPECIES: hypothetical protein [Bacillus subtilis group]MEC0475647.1 hypothetical protein [Bacillus licheniformis]PAD58245.1 hypothetical protein CHH92_20845 [Bacillus sonorensis]RZV63669.1 hypothetical protein EX342_07175 [Bacillus paralicheniformis]